MGDDSTVIGADGIVAFNLGAAFAPNVGFTSVPAPGGTTFVIATAGDYEYDFYIAGVPAAPSANKSLELVIDVNGLASSPANQFRSNTTTTSGDVLTVHGQGILALAAGDAVTLHNVTRGGLDTVTVTASPPGGTTGANRTLALKLLS